MKLLCIFDSYFSNDLEKGFKIIKGFAKNRIDIEFEFLSPKLYYKSQYDGVYDNSNDDNDIYGLQKHEINNEIEIRIASIISKIKAEKPLIITFGKLSFTSIAGIDGEVTDGYENLVGDFLEIYGTRIYPGYHIQKIFNTNYHYQKTKFLIEKVINYGNNGDPETKFKILTPKEAIQKCEEVIDLYKSNIIDHIYHDTETEDLTYYDGSLIMHSLSHDKDLVNYSIPLQISNINPHGDKYLYPFKELNFEITNKDRVLINKSFGTLLREVPSVGFHYNFDMIQMQANDIINIDDVKLKDDGLILAYLMFGRQFGVKLALKDISRMLVTVDNDWDIEISEYLKLFKRIADRKYSNIPTWILGKYAALDTFYLKLCYNCMINQLDDDMVYIKNILIDSVKLFANIEYKGAKIDKDMVEYLDKVYTGHMVDSESVVRSLPTIKKLCKNSINVEEVKAKLSKKHKDEETIRLKLKEETDNQFTMTGQKCMKTLLYDKEYFGLPVVLKTKTNNSPSISAEALEILEKLDYINDEQRTFFDNMFKYRTFQKLVSTYVDKFKATSENNYLYKTYFNLTKVVTGRLSSEFHVIPSKSDLKRVITSRWKDEGGLIIAADYSQIEYRICGAVANEESWISAYKAGVDNHEIMGARASGKVPVHMPTSDIITQLDSLGITSDERKIGKAINFGVIYQQGAPALAETLGCTLEEAEEFLTMFKTSAPNVHDWSENQKKFVRQHGYVKSIYNRVIDLPDIYSNDRGFKLKAERQSVNYPIQSTASDYVLISINKINKRMKKLGLKSILIGSVHDSILIDVYPGELFEVAYIVKDVCEREMVKENDWWLNGMPIIIDVGIGTSWGSAIESKKIKFGNGSVEIQGKAMKRDWKELISVAEQHYSTELDILDKRKLDPSKFKIDNPITDTVEYVAKLKIF